VDRVHRCALHLRPELLQQRVVLSDEEPLPVVEELVRPERFQRRLDDAQAEQARRAGPDLAPVPWRRSQDRDRARWLVEPAGLPPPAILVAAVCLVSALAVCGRVRVASDMR
jgi:hypothetical protein